MPSLPASARDICIPPTSSTYCTAVCNSKSLAVGILVAGKALPDSASAPEIAEVSTKEDPKPEEPKSRASRLAYKKVDKV